MLLQSDDPQIPPREVTVNLSPRLRCIDLPSALAQQTIGLGCHGGQLFIAVAIFLYFHAEVFACFQCLNHFVFLLVKG